MTIRIETGPFPGAPYANWKFWEIDRVEAQHPEQFAAEYAELKEFLQEVDKNDSPYGPFEDQVEAAILAVSEDNPRKMLTLPSCIFVKDKDGEDTNEIVQTFDLDVRVVWLGTDIQNG